LKALNYDFHHKALILLGLTNIYGLITLKAAGSPEIITAFNDTLSCVSPIRKKLDVN